MSDQVSLAKCSNGHEWPEGTKFCGICGEKVRPILTKIGHFFAGVGQIGGEILLEYVSRLGPADTRSVLIETSSESVAKFYVTSSKLAHQKEFSEGVHLLSDKVRGTGRSWKIAETAASEDKGLEPFLIERGAQRAETAFLMGALGGGTGAGVIPYVSNLLSEIAECDRIALLVMPSQDEPDLSHFNAYCGLSKLLRLHRRQNVDFLIIVDGTYLQKFTPMKSSGEEMSRIETMAAIIEILARQRDRYSEKWFGLADLVRLGRSAGVIHAIPTLALNHSLRIYDELPGVLDSALTQALGEVKPESVMFAPVYVSVPLHLRKTLSEEVLVKQYNQWRIQTFPGETMGEICISYTENPSRFLDALVLLCGCDLDDSLSRTSEGYRRVKNTLLARKLEEHEEISPQTIQVVPEELLSIERTLNDYIAGVRALYKKKPSKK